MNISNSDREKLFILMYQSEFNKTQTNLIDLDMIDSMNIYLDNSSCDEEIDEKLHIKLDDEVVDIFKDIASNIESIDELIKLNLKNWNISRIGKLELAVLRLMCYELKILKSEKIGYIVSNYLDILKKYFVEEEVATKSSSFVNGVIKNILEEN